MKKYIEKKAAAVRAVQMTKRTIDKPSLLPKVFHKFFLELITLKLGQNEGEGNFFARDCEDTLWSCSVNEWHAPVAVTDYIVITADDEVFLMDAIEFKLTYKEVK